MKILFIGATLMLMACGKGGSQGCNSGGTAQDNDQTVSLINGACSMETQTNWQNQTYTDAVLCGQLIIMQGQTVCQLDASQITSATTGCPTQSDDYYVIPSADGASQCWFKITSGLIDPNAQPPTF